MHQLDEVAAARSRKQKAFALINPLIGEIAEALMDFGGEAHRSVVINRVAQRRAGMTATALPSEGLTRELIAAFEMHCGHAQKNGQPPLLHLPFGADSHRWSLTREARVLFRQLKRVSAR